MTNDISAVLFFQKIRKIIQKGRQSMPCSIKKKSIYQQGWYRPSMTVSHRKKQKNRKAEIVYPNPSFPVFSIQHTFSVQPVPALAALILKYVFILCHQVFSYNFLATITNLPFSCEYSQVESINILSPYFSVPSVLNIRLSSTKSMHFRKSSSLSYWKNW